MAGLTVLNVDVWEIERESAIPEAVIHDGVPDGVLRIVGRFRMAGHVKIIYYTNAAVMHAAG